MINSRNVLALFKTHQSASSPNFIISLRFHECEDKKTTCYIRWHVIAMSILMRSHWKIHQVTQLEDSKLKISFLNIWLNNLIEEMHWIMKMIFPAPFIKRLQLIFFFSSRYENKLWDFAVFKVWNADERKFNWNALRKVSDMKWGLASLFENASIF